MMQQLPCDALICRGVPNLIPRPGGALLRLGDDATQWVPAVQAWLANTIKYSSHACGLAIEGPETDAERDVISAVVDHYHRASVQQKTVAAFAVEWGRNFCKTLIRQPRWATSLQEPWAGRPAFIVSAGPSLDRNGALLAEAQKRGPIIALNSSVSACLSYGVVPDLVMCSEAVDVSDKLATLHDLGIQVALDSVAHQANWAAAPHAWAYSWAEPNIVPYVLKLDALPLNYTGSVACGAVALALLWGADPVVLLGQDCAYTDGRMYASGTPYADIRCEQLDGLLRFTGSSKECTPVAAVQRVAWGGDGQVTTSHDLEVFVDWFESCASQYTLVNATEGGCQMQYTYEQPLSAVLDVLPERPRVTLPQPENADTSSVRAELVREARALLAGDAMTVPPSFPLLNMWAVPAVFEGNGLPPLERHACMRRAMERGAREILELIA